MGLLAFSGGSGMAAHGREDEGFGAPGLELVAKGFHDFLVVREPAAAGCDADAFTRQAGRRLFIESQELLFQCAHRIG